MKYRIISLSIWEQLEVDKARRIKREEKISYRNGYLCRDRCHRHYFNVYIST
ncbi:protein of unknown function [Petrocella atlantisensis]|uniref:Uncharacterized protein n=1 Tax=Petrocella atlantisensis TaxID=2173034 RepID=A0A3P7PEF4_9FIRM|nr:protein of unknown function [Petrocella atlantisensis]